MRTPSTFDTFQISTDQVSNQSQIPSESQIVHFGSEIVRLDAPLGNQHRPHYRAEQLNEFTNWLYDEPQNSATHKLDNNKESDSDAESNLSGKTAVAKPISSDPLTARVQGVNAKKMYRIDTPPDTQTNPTLRRPNFDTTDYVGHPESIEETIRQLKADGRIIGDLNQLSDSTCEKDSNLQQFRWPKVSDRLLASPELSHLETNIQNFIGSAASKKLTICGSESGSGATTLAISIARRLACHGQRVLLVDANLANAVIAGRLGIANPDSWLQSISTRRALPDIIVKDKSSNVDFLPLVSLKSVAWPRRLFDQLGRIIDSVASDYGLIIFDVGVSTQLVQESEKPKHLAALTLLVTGQGNSSNEEFKRSRILLSEAGVDNILVIENFSRPNASSHSKVG